MGCADGGSTATFTAIGETLDGNLYADSTSTASASLQSGTTLTGTITRTALSIDPSSVWTVTGDSILTSLADASGISGSTVTNIPGNGHTVTYDSSLAANSYLGGLTYSLVNRGVLAPAGTPASATSTPTPTDTPVPSVTTPPTPTKTLSSTPTCVGDCDDNSHVTVDDVLTMINIALGNVPVSACWAGDADNSGAITVDEILMAVNNALSGCR